MEGERAAVSQRGGGEGRAGRGAAGIKEKEEEGGVAIDSS